MSCRRSNRDSALKEATTVYGSAEAGAAMKQLKEIQERRGQN